MSFPILHTPTQIVPVLYDGFAGFTRSDVRVAINNVTRVDVTLKLGAVSETEVKKE